jgi:uncharacterized protein YggE
MHLSLRRAFFITMFLSLPLSPSLAQDETKPAKPAGTLSIVGQGEYDAKPTRADLFGTVSTSGKTAAAARDPHPAKVARVRAIIDGLAANGLKIESATYALRGSTPYENSPAGTVSAKDRRMVVYEATTTFRLSTANLAKIADLASVLANSDLELSSISFGVNNPRAAVLEARKNAAKDALNQANAYADALGVDLVEIREITDGEATPPSDEQADLAMPTRIPGEKIPLSLVIPDSLTYTASVSVDWTIKLKAR